LRIVIRYLFAFAILLGYACSIDELNIDEQPVPPVILVDDLDREWDITQAVLFFDFEPSGFTGGTGATTPLSLPIFIDSTNTRFPAPDETFELAGAFVGIEWRAYALDNVAQGVVINDAFGPLIRVAIILDPVNDEVSAYDRSIGLEPVSLASTGWAYNGRTVFYDLETESLWYRIEGTSRLTCVNGPGIRSELLPKSVTRAHWNEWIVLHPDTKAYVGRRAATN
jgi:hypothetical protein